MRKHLFVASAAVAAALFAASPALAAGGPVLTSGSVGGTGLANGATVSASLASGSKAFIATTSGGSTGITCTQANLAATVTANPDSSGNADESLTSLTTTSCTANILGVSKVNSVALNNLPYSASVTPAGVLTVTGSIQSTVSLQTILGAVTCVYTATSLTGATHNTGNTIALTNQQFNLKTGPGVCPKNGFLSATVGPVTSGGANVFVNPGQN